MKRPIFARRHYQAVAEVFRDSRAFWNLSNSEKSVLMVEFMAMFERDHPGFKPDRFLKACGWFAQAKG